MQLNAFMIEIEVLTYSRLKNYLSNKSLNLRKLFPCSIRMEMEKSRLRN
ncbi:unnamed protein product [Debaryomyces tyrocola]|nr:unnamed protein product [Debaryomyces tyrocola]